MNDSNDDAFATRSLQPPSPGALESRAYLVVVEGETSSMYHLPRNGVVLVGRGPEADLRLSDETASRKHAKIMISDGEARVADLESHNGTLVNGEKIAGAQSLVSGDVIGVASALLVLHAASVKSASKQVVERAQLRRRLDEELERARRYARPLTVAAVSLGAGGQAGKDKESVDEAARANLRIIDVVAFAGEAQLLVLLPELHAESAEPLVRALLAALPGARAGVASYPSDGCDADTLVQAARSAAGEAQAGQVVCAEETIATLEVGERRVVVADPAMSRLYALVKRLAASELPVLILGETGVGKENAAYAVHAWSSRAKKPFVTINCAAIQETLVESELFGYEKGAFSGAQAAKVGLLESGSGGTVFLDEIGELPQAVQAKLLRVLETKRLTRLGDVREREIDIRIVAATNRNLEAEVKSGGFRQDLYFRIGAAQVVLPPLRERPREVPVLARTFLAAACAKANRPELPIATEAVERLAQFAWPGNVRELKNVMDYAAATVAEDTLELWHLPERISGEPALPSPASEDEPAATPAPSGKTFRPIAEELRALERRRMKEALDASDGVQRRAADLLAMPLRTFVMKYKQYGLKKEDS